MHLQALHSRTLAGSIAVLGHSYFLFLAGQLLWQLPVHLQRIFADFAGTMRYHSEACP